MINSIDLEERELLNLHLERTSNGLQQLGGQTRIPHANMIANSWNTSIGDFNHTLVPPYYIFLLYL